MVLRQHGERVRAHAETERRAVVRRPTRRRSAADRTVRAEAAATGVLVRRERANPAVVGIDADDRQRRSGSPRSTRARWGRRGRSQARRGSCAGRRRATRRARAPRADPRTSRAARPRAPRAACAPARSSRKSAHDLAAREARLAEQRLATAVVAAGHGPELGGAVPLAVAQRDREERLARRRGPRAEGSTTGPCTSPISLPRVALDPAEPDDFPGLTGDEERLGRRERASAASSRASSALLSTPSSRAPRRRAPRRREQSSAMASTSSPRNASMWTSSWAC